jgi:hypothetical protein
MIWQKDWIPPAARIPRIPQPQPCRRGSLADLLGPLVLWLVVLAFTLAIIYHFAPQSATVRHLITMSCGL